MENLVGLNLLDGIILGLIFFLSLIGLIRGFSKELFNAIGIIGGLFVATYFNKDLASYLQENILTDVSIKVLELISLVAIFLLFFIVSKIIYKIVSSFFYNDYLSLTSRIGGMIIKMVTLFFIFSLIVFGLSSKPQVVNTFKETISSSKLFPILRDSGAKILNSPVVEVENKDNKSITDVNSSEKVEKDKNSTKNTLDSNVSQKVTENNTTNLNVDDINNTYRKDINNSANMGM